MQLLPWRKKEAERMTNQVNTNHGQMVFKNFMMPISKQTGGLITLILFGVFCFGQGERVNRSKIDSLRTLFPTLLGSARVDCLNELGGSYISLNRGYFLSLDKDSPDSRQIQSLGSVIALPEVGGLHHRYERRTA